MRWAVAAVAGMVSILGATYLLVHGGTNREQCLAEPAAGCLLDLAEESLADIAEENARSDMIRGIAVARAQARDFKGALAAAGKLRDERDRAVLLLEIAEEQGKAGRSDAAEVTIERVLEGIGGEDAALKGRAAIAFGTIGNATAALRIVDQIPDDRARKENMASVYFALADVGRSEFAAYVAKFDFTGDSERLKAHVTRLAELSEDLARAGRIGLAHSVLRTARQKARPVIDGSLSSALSAATITIDTQMGHYDAALKRAKSNPNFQFRVKHILSVAKAMSKSGDGQRALGTLDDLMVAVRDVSEPMIRESLLAYMATGYAASGYPQRASGALSEISTSLFRASAYGALARGLLNDGRIEASQAYLDLAVDELRGLQRGVNEDIVVRGVADQLARAGRAKQALELILGVSDAPADIASAYVSLARKLTESERPQAPVETKPAAVAGPADDAGWVTRVVRNGGSGEFQHGTYPSFGDRTHVGYDIAAPCGSEIRAWNDGTVVDSIVSSGDRDFDTLGYMVLIRHAPLKDGRPTYSLYLNMLEAPATRPGPVEAGETIGKVGKTGLALDCMVHFEIRHFDGRFHPGWTSIYGQGDQRASAEFLGDWTDPDAWDPSVSAEAAAVEAMPAGEEDGSRSSPSGPGEANRLFVEAVQLYRQAADKSADERLADYRRIMANIDRILDEFGDTDIARRIDSGAPLGPLDLQRVRLFVEDAGSNSG